MFRFKSNCSVMLVDPRLLDEVISVTDAIRLNCRSKGAATEDAMVSGLAPGSPAPTEMVGKSTCGSGDTGRMRNATMPAKAMAMVNNVVATGRRMKISEIFMLIAPVAAPRPVPLHALFAAQTGAPGGRTTNKSPASYRASVPG